MSHIRAKFESIDFDCLLNLNEQIVPRFVLEFYSQLTFDYNSTGHFVVNFVIQSKSFSLTLEEFGQILKIPFKGHASHTDMWSLDYLSISVPSKGCYKTTPPSPSVVKSFIQIPRQGQVTRTKNKKTIVVDKNKILTREIQPHMKPWVDIIRENAICLGGHKDHVSASLDFLELDVLISIEITSDLYEGPMCRPLIMDTSSENEAPFLAAKNLGHLVLRNDTLGDGTFIPNDVCIGGSDHASFIVLTGPNMGGKSTLLHQVGSDVPTESFKMSPVDRIFVSLCHMACRVRNGVEGLEEVTFLYKLTLGACPKSYGVNVAHLAGLLDNVLQKAAFA
ncbi:pentatricopeptide repeat-containing protein [Tanacetum coccineum]